MTLRLIVAKNENVVGTDNKHTAYHTIDFIIQDQIDFTDTTILGAEIVADAYPMPNIPQDAFMDIPQDTLVPNNIEQPNEEENSEISE